MTSKISKKSLRNNNQQIKIAMFAQHILGDINQLFSAKSSSKYVRKPYVYMKNISIQYEQNKSVNISILNNQF